MNRKQKKQTRVKDFEIGTKLECVVFTRGKNRRRFFSGKIVEKGGRKHFVGYQGFTRLSFGPGTILESKEELNYQRRRTPWRHMYLVGTIWEGDL